MGLQQVSERLRQLGGKDAQHLSQALIHALNQRTPGSAWKAARQEWEDRFVGALKYWHTGIDWEMGIPKRLPAPQVEAWIKCEEAQKNYFRALKKACPDIQPLQEAVEKARKDVSIAIDKWKNARKIAPRGKLTREKWEDTMLAVKAYYRELEKAESVCLWLEREARKAAPFETVLSSLGKHAVVELRGALQVQTNALVRLVAVNVLGAIARGNEAEQAILQELRTLRAQSDNGKLKLKPLQEAADRAIQRLSGAPKRTQ